MVWAIGWGGSVPCGMHGIIDYIAYWDEPERAPPGQFNGCAVYLYIYLYPSYVVHTWSLQWWARSQTGSSRSLRCAVSFPDLQFCLVPRLVRLVPIDVLSRSQICNSVSFPDLQFSLVPRLVRLVPFDVLS